MMNDINENSSELSDEALMLQCKEDVAGAFDILIERHKDSLYRYIFAMIRDEATSEEIFQDVFLQVYKSRKKYQPKAKFSTFLFKIAQNRALNELRRRRMLAKNELRELSIERSNPLASLLEKERKMVLLDSLTKLPPKLHSAYILHEIEGLAYKEIASIQKCRIGTVKSRLSRAREKLCEELKKYEL